MTDKKFEIIDPKLMNFCGNTIKIITYKDKQYLGDYHKIASFECDLQGIDKFKHTLYAQKSIGFFIKDFSQKEGQPNDR